MKNSNLTDLGRKTLAIFTATAMLLSAPGSQAWASRGERRAPQPIGGLHIGPVGSVNGLSVDLMKDVQTPARVEASGDAKAADAPASGAASAVEQAFMRADQSEGKSPVTVMGQIQKTAGVIDADRPSSEVAIALGNMFDHNSSARSAEAAVLKGDAETGRAILATANRKTSAEKMSAQELASVIAAAAAYPSIKKERLTNAAVDALLQRPNVLTADLVRQMGRVHSSGPSYILHVLADGEAKPTRGALDAAASYLVPGQVDYMVETAAKVLARGASESSVFALSQALADNADAKEFVREALVDALIAIKHPSADLALSAALQRETKTYSTLISSKLLSILREASTEARSGSKSAASSRILAERISGILATAKDSKIAAERQHAIDGTRSTSDVIMRMIFGGIVFLAALAFLSELAKAAPAAAVAGVAQQDLAFAALMLPLVAAILVLGRSIVRMERSQAKIRAMSVAELSAAVASGSYSDRHYAAKRLLNTESPEAMEALAKAVQAEIIAADGKGDRKSLPAAAAVLDLYAEIARSGKGEEMNKALHALESSVFDRITADRPRKLLKIAADRIIEGGVDRSIFYTLGMALNNFVVGAMVGPMVLQIAGLILGLPIFPGVAEAAVIGTIAAMYGVKPYKAPAVENLASILKHGRPASGPSLNSFMIGGLVVTGAAAVLSSTSGMALAGKGAGVAMAMPWLMPALGAVLFAAVAVVAAIALRPSGKSKGMTPEQSLAAIRAFESVRDEIAKGRK